MAERVKKRGVTGPLGTLTPVTPCKVSLFEVVEIGTQGLLRVWVWVPGGKVNPGFPLPGGEISLTLSHRSSFKNTQQSLRLKVDGVRDIGSSAGSSEHCQAEGESGRQVPQAGPAPTGPRRVQVPLPLQLHTCSHLSTPGLGPCTSCQVKEVSWPGRQPRPGWERPAGRPAWSSPWCPSLLYAFLPPQQGPISPPIVGPPGHLGAQQVLGVRLPRATDGEEPFLRMIPSQPGGPHT